MVQGSNLTRDQRVRRHDRVNNDFMDLRIAFQKQRINKQYENVVNKTSKVMRNFLHKMRGVEKELALELAEANMMITEDGVPICEYCKTEKINMESH